MTRQNIRISACYIVKNEASNIVRSIGSIADDVDEVIVVDTGSTDGTVEAMEELAAGGACRLYHFAWCDDFSAARNHALERATGDWVVFLDADEYVTEETQTHLRKVIEKYSAYDGLLLPRLNVEEDGSMLGEDAMLRAFKKTEGTRYRGRIHEELWRGDHPLGHLQLRALRKDELCILHTGYERTVSRAKAERNLKLLLEDMAQDEDKAHYYHYLADAYYGLDNEREAVRYARMDVDLGPQPRTNPASSYRILLHYAKSAGEKRSILERAVRDYLREASFHADLAETLAYALHFSDAVKSMEKAISLYQTQGGMPRELHSLARMHIVQWKSVLARAKSIRISACCIVKNEEKDLPRWLESTAVYADERIVVDTGSTDATLAILEKAQTEQGTQSPLRVHRIEWKDDFAVAKNYAIEQATGDWIAFLDADEYFETPELVRSYIAMMSLRDIVPEAMHLPIINIDEDRDNMEIHRFAGIRIFQRRDDIRYHGRIHETIRKAGGEMALYWEKERMPILHLGYSLKRMERKNQRNFELLLKDIEENGEQPAHWGYLSECYFGFGDFEKSLYYALKTIHEGCTYVGSASDYHRRAIAAMHRLGRPLEEIQVAVEEAIEAFPELPDFYGELGVVLQQRSMYEEALDALHRALELGEHMAGGEASMFHNQRPMLSQAITEIEERLRTANENSEEGTGADRGDTHIKISACCIVKNEEKDLPRWLENTAVYADERIVVDTGSTDTTLAILEKAQAGQGTQSPIRVHRIAWQDDFAAAKNFAIEQATGDWIAFLDADEYFAAPELVRPYIETINEEDRPDAVQLPMVHIDEDRDGKEMYRSAAVRVFRRTDDMRYTGRIHENLVKRNGKVALRSETEKLYILHAGYSAKRMEQKMERNFAHLQKEIAEKGEQPVHWRYLAESYYGFGDYETSLQYVHKALSAGELYLGSTSDLYRRGIACMYQLGYVLSEIQAFVERAIEVFPELPDFYADLGMILKDRGRYEEALVALRRSLAAAEAGAGAEASEFASKRERVLAEMAELERAAEARGEEQAVEQEQSIDTGDMLIRIARLQRELFVVLAERIVRGDSLAEMAAEGRLLSAEMKDALKALAGGAQGALSTEACRRLEASIVQYGSAALRERYRACSGEVRA